MTPGASRRQRRTCQLGASGRVLVAAARAAGLSLTRTRGKIKKFSILQIVVYGLNHEQGSASRF